ncbi:hypothetical protein CRM22_005350 [Opisthorchis felineus]|uniref:dolichyl-P-Man:Man5GlcNAc2-PP-dolichol alpha-1,3-mannosyltransferase n=2 Tax=Opisthorchis felineus TaxID=147828 RepID=A0A4V3SEY5_OPIFE|nr:hypothetical protein CRM22_005350 [Opisthorchis felineus]
MALEAVEKFSSRILFSKNGYSPVSCILLLAELALSLFVVWNVKYTEIDWIAYMQEVEGFVNGTLDYDKLEGQTGPCVYPAGFLYIYWMLYQITSRGTLIHLAQYIFIGLYLLTLVLVFNIYRLSCQVPPYVFVFMCVISYRIHSIYVLRLFNDPLAMIALYACVNFLLYGKFTLACIFFSLGVSVKMNILLFAPGLFLILLYYRGILETAGHLCECIIVQLVLGAPFLFHNYEAYISRAFNFGRQFMYKWTVNWRIIPEDVFLDRRFHAVLLGLHAAFLIILLFRWIRYRGGFSQFLKLQIPPDRDPRKDMSGVIYPMFLSNFIGVTFSRSLHYQFYVWYFHTIPYLLWTTSLPSNPLKLLIFGLIEVCWNTYPSTVFSSGLLHTCHAILLASLVFAPLPTASLERVSSKVSMQSIPNKTTAPSKRRGGKAKLA